MLAGRTSARALAVIFAAALIYGSLCSTACGLGICPNQENQPASHECDHPFSSNHSGSSHHRGPARPDCYAHHHPSVEFVKADGLPQWEQAKAGGIAIGELLCDFSHADIVHVKGSCLSALGSPPSPQDSLYLRISVLRI